MLSFGIKWMDYVVENPKSRVECSAVHPTHTDLLRDEAEVRKAGGHSGGIEER